LRHNPQSCLAIEDTQKGATAAKNAGMKVAAISVTNANINNADIVARNYAEIDDWIRGYDLNES
jgi:beta-phosphoglucomutase-like phosphatase (HAD superfamily)